LIKVPDGFPPSIALGKLVVPQLAAAAPSQQMNVSNQARTNHNLFVSVLVYDLSTACKQNNLHFTTIFEENIS
jgi:hypothetical protein